MLESAGMFHESLEQIMCYRSGSSPSRMYVICSNEEHKSITGKDKSYPVR